MSTPFMARLALIAAESNIHFHAASLPVIARKVRDRLGGDSADAYDSGQLLAALQGVRETDSKHFSTLQPQTGPGSEFGASRLERANREADAAQRREGPGIPMFGRMEGLDDAKRAQIAKMKPEMKLQIANDAAHAAMLEAQKKKSGGNG